MTDDLDPLRPVIVTMPKEIDAGNASAVGDTLDAAFALGATAVVADCTPTTFCDSVGYNTLLLTNQKARAAKAELLFVITPSSQMRRVLELLEMLPALAVYPSIDAAVTASRQLPTSHAACAGPCPAPTPARRQEAQQPGSRGDARLAALRDVVYRVDISI